MNPYQTLATYYDQFTEDVNYPAWADFFEELFRREGLQPRLILDLACGTGTLTRLLANRGYDLIGVDASVDMLMRATDQTSTCSPRPLFLNQRMEQLDLYGTVDVCLCCLDSLNYITDPNALQHTLERVYLFLEPETGLFVFDINTPAKFAKMNGNSYVCESKGVFCVWQAAVQDGLCVYPFNIFEQTPDGLWNRKQEWHEERIYTPAVLMEMLHRVGFADIQTYGNQSFAPVQGGEDRIYFTARKKG